MAACVLFMQDVDFIHLLVTHRPSFLFLPGRGWRRVLRCPGELGCFVSPEGHALMSRSTRTVHPVSVTDKRVDTARKGPSFLGGALVSTHVQIRRAKELKAGLGGK